MTDHKQIIKDFSIAFKTLFDKVSKNKKLNDRDEYVLREAERLTEIIDGGKITTGEAPRIIYSSELLNILQTTQRELTSFTKKGIFPNKKGRTERNESYYDIIEIIKCLWKSNIQNVEAIDELIKKEKLRGLEIKNNNEAGFYLEKEKCAERTETLLRAIMNMFYYAIKKSSPMLAGCRSAADAEKIQLLNYESVFKTLEEESKELEWKDEK